MLTSSVMQRDANGSPLGVMGGTGWPVTHAHATASLAVKAAVATETHVITGFYVASDLATAVINVKSGTTVVMGPITNVAAGWQCVTLPSPIKCVAGELASVGIDGTSACSATMFGYTLAE